MGGSNSKSVSADSPYFTLMQEVALQTQRQREKSSTCCSRSTTIETAEPANFLVDAAELFDSYRSTYVSFLEDIKGELRAAAFPFSGEIGGHRVIQDKSFRLSPSGINKTLNELCKKSFLQCDDMVIQFKAKADIPPRARSPLIQYLARNSSPSTVSKPKSTLLPATIVLSGSLQERKRTWFSYRVLQVDLEAEDVEDLGRALRVGDAFVASVQTMFDLDETGWDDEVNDSREENSCCVCMCSLHEGGGLVALPCSHVLHEYCRNQLICHSAPEKASCPLCRKEFGNSR